MNVLLQKLVYHLTIEPRLKRLKKLLPDAKIRPAGSRYVCAPPVMYTDVDFIIYSDKPVAEALIGARYKETEKDRYGNDLTLGDITCYRRGVVNVIVAHTWAYYETFCVATHICKKYNIRWKPWRVLAHEAVRGSHPAGYGYPEFDGLEDLQGLHELLLKLTGTHAVPLRRAYIIQHGVEL